MEEKNDISSGSFVFVDGSTYDGEYNEVDDVRLRHGQGTFADGPDVYSGNWENDVMSGEGKYMFASGAWYNGEFVNGKMEGHGKYKWPDGSSYTGGWRENKMHGEVRFFFL
mmetsp:Transcript_14778/g.19165  ORF Transcript_14778/g.19165 Transcript_14778/m.19165 type:complete len:111 (-) Transcript_14778:360-692(-)